MNATIIQPALSPMSNISPFLLICLKKYSKKSVEQLFITKRLSQNLGISGIEIAKAMSQWAEVPVSVLFSPCPALHGFPVRRNAACASVSV